MLQTSTTPVPNFLFDIHLKELKSAELKVILIIIRQTLGWVDRRAVLGRKERDWISSSQLQSKTGSSQRAISSAIETLVKKNLIDVLDERGNNLDTADKRKGKPRLYYRLATFEEKPVENYVYIDPAYANFAEDFDKKCTALAQKMRITKETLQK